VFLGTRSSGAVPFVSVAGFGGMHERGELRSTLRSWIVDEPLIVNS
jgi:hypothetical protein